MAETVYRLSDEPWAPWVVREGDELQIQLGVDFNRGYDIREFFFAITQAHLDVLRNDLPRHLILWCALEAMCEHAGRGDKRGKPNKRRARQAIDVVLLGSPPEVEAYVAREEIPTRRLIAHGADPDLLEAGRLFQALGPEPGAAGKWALVWEHDADRDRARRGITLGPMDTALLRYTNRYLHGTTLASRRPADVEPARLDAVEALIAAAEAACAGLPGSAPTSEYAARVEPVLRAVHPDLTDQAVTAVSSLICTEAPRRHWARMSLPPLADVRDRIAFRLYGAQDLEARRAHSGPGEMPCTKRLGDDLVLGADLKIPWEPRATITEAHAEAWEAQHGVRFPALLRAASDHAPVGRERIEDGVCVIRDEQQAAAVLFDPRHSARIVKPPSGPGFAMRGDLVVLVPSRTCLVMTGSEDEAGVARAIDLAEEAGASGEELVSVQPLVHQWGQWLPFDWGAAFPALATRRLSRPPQ